MDSFYAWLCFSFTAYVLVNSVVLPHVRRAWIASRPLGKVAKVGMIAALESVRTTALIALLVWTAFAVLVIALGVVYGENIERLSRLVKLGLCFHKKLTDFDDIWSRWYVLLPVAMTMYVSWHERTKAAARRVAQAIEVETDRINAERERDPAKWNATPRSPEMLECLRRKAELSALLVETAVTDAKRAALRRELVQLDERMTHLDEERRIDNRRVAAAAVEGDNKPTWKNFLVSEGLLSDLGSLSKGLSRSVTALLALTLINAASQSGAADEIKKRLLDIDELRVTATNKQVESSWDHATTSPQQPEITQENERAAEKLSELFLNALTRNPQWHAGVAPTWQIKRNLVREIVLRATRLPASNTDDQSRFKTSVEPLYEAVVERVSEQSSQSQAARKLTEQERSNIIHRLGQRWNVITNQVNEHVSKYRVRVGTEELQSELVEELISIALDQSEPYSGDNVIAKKLQGAVSTGLKKGLRDGVLMSFHKLLRDLGAGSSVDDALDRVRTGDMLVTQNQVGDAVTALNASALTAHALNQAVQRGTTVMVAPEDLSRTSARQRTQPKTSTVTVSGTALDASAKPDVRGLVRNLQKGGSGARAGTSESDQPHTFGEAVPGATRAENPAPSPASSVTRVTPVLPPASRPSSLPKLPRKGVFIGQALANPRDSVDVIDIAWRYEGHGLALTLRDFRGKATELGVFERGLIHQALAYAADGRPLAVTMTPLSPTLPLQVLLHPALLDTPLGCQMIALDRLVDTYAGSDLYERTAVAEHYNGQVSLYELAHARRALLLSSQGVPERRAHWDAVVNTHLETATQALAHKPFAAPNILSARPAYFDQELVQTALRCATEVSSIDDYQRCVSAAFDPRAVRLHEGDWLQAAVSLVHVGLVRELPYYVTEDLAFLRMPGATASRPFEFTVAATLLTSAHAQPVRVEYELIASTIQQRVNHGIERNKLQNMLGNLRAFAILQRLFASALGGQLGVDFPIEKLGELSIATAGKISYVRTQRWNGSVTQRLAAHLLEQSRELAVRPELERVAAALYDCAQQALAAGTTPTALSKCDINSLDEAAETITVARALPDIRNREVELGVLQDELWSADDRGCGAWVPQLTPGGS